jgi:hypothetical protein
VGEQGVRWIRWRPILKKFRRAILTSTFNKGQVRYGNDADAD